MLVTSIFSFSYNVFCLSQSKFQFFSYIFLSSANAFNLDQSKSLWFGKKLTTLEKEAVENILGKGENGGNQHFLLFPQYFQPFPTQISIFQ